ncbi:MAG: adenylate/guanylate cyclase domain-containing protein [Elsteraceae bacterium]
MTALFTRANLRRLRLATGLILFAFVGSHLLNHALGIVSLAAMEAGLRVNQVLWMNGLGGAILFGALLTHLGLGLWALYERRWRRVRASEMAQLALGLTIPALLLGHVMANRVAFEAFGRVVTYEPLLLLFWHSAPSLGVRQACLLVITWGHGCLGVYFWLRLKPNFQRWSHALAILAALIPALALIGFANGGREVARLANDPAYVQQVIARAAMSPEAQQALADWHDNFLAGYLALILLAFAGRGLRSLRERRSDGVMVRYPDGRAIRLPQGMTLLDASRLLGFPHASVCGGRGRCSTCRARILKGIEGQPPPGEAESAVLRRVDADPLTRLACQLRPNGDLTIAPLIQADAPLSRKPGGAGRERMVAILFTDIRGSTPIVEKRLPYDIVFLLNRFFETIGSAVIEVGGFPNQFIGDSVMALFGAQVGAQGETKDACLQALQAAQHMADKLDQMNQAMSDDLPQPIRIGIGLHAGPAIVGEMGYAGSITTTAVGDPVHVAARLQELTKTYACQLIVSESLAQSAGVDLSRFRREEIQVRGRQQPLGIFIIPNAKELGLAVTLQT